MWIVDVGCHDGEDSAYYLAKGYNVIGVEADPILCADLRFRFATEIEAGKFSLVEGAITENSGSGGFISLYKNKSKSVWNTIDPEWAGRNSKLGTNSVEIKVPVIDLVRILEKIGPIEYIKIDIEGVDLGLLKQLGKSNICPNAISLESNKIDFSGLVEEIETLTGMGYTRFMAVQQFSVPFQQAPSGLTKVGSWDGKFKLGSSGLFGDDLRGNWENAEEILIRYEKIFREYRKFGDNSIFRKTSISRLVLQSIERLTGIGLPGWYDTHAIK